MHRAEWENPDHWLTEEVAVVDRNYWTREDCIQALRKYREEIEAILQLFPSTGPVAPGRRPLIRELYSNLKTKLRADYKEGVPKNSDPHTVQIHRQYFFPVIAKAYTRLHVATNAVPDQRMFSQLAEAQADIDRYLNRLERKASPGA